MRGSRNHMGRNREDATRFRPIRPRPDLILKSRPGVRQSAPARADEQTLVLSVAYAASGVDSGGFASPDGGDFTTPVVSLTMTLFQMLSLGTIFVIPSSVRM